MKDYYAQTYFEIIRITEKLLYGCYDNWWFSVINIIIYGMYTFIKNLNIKRRQIDFSFHLWIMFSLPINLWSVKCLSKEIVRFLPMLWMVRIGCGVSAHKHKRFFCFCYKETNKVTHACARWFCSCRARVLHVNYSRISKPSQYKTTHKMTHLFHFNFTSVY